MVSAGKRIRIAYDLTIDDRLIKSFSRNKPYSYAHGRRNGTEIPLGLEKAVKGMRIGEQRTIILKAKEGYGVQNQRSIMEMPKKRFSKKDHIVGRTLRSERDGKYLARVAEVRKETLMLDFNHPYAGKTLRYEVFVVGIEGESAPMKKTPETAFADPSGSVKPRWASRRAH